MGPVEKLLREAGELLRDESKRCRYHFAVNAKGNTVRPQSKNAARWCVLGAVFRSASITNSDAYGPAARRVLSTSARNIGDTSAARLNDEHSELIEDLFSEAIEAACELNL